MIWRVAANKVRGGTFAVGDTHAQSNAHMRGMRAGARENG